MTDNNSEKDCQVNCCCECVHAKRRFFEWFCTCPEIVGNNLNFVTGKREKLLFPCENLRISHRCPYYEARAFAPPRKNPNEIPQLPPRSFVPPKETPMHKAPPRANEINGCDSCRWHQQGVFNGLVMYHVCKHEKSKWDGWYHLRCIDMRLNEDLCGKEKMLYKPKETQK